MRRMPSVDGAYISVKDLQVSRAAFASFLQTVSSLGFIGTSTMATNSKKIKIPNTYVTSPEAYIRVTNYPESASEVTPIQVVTLNRPNKLNAINGDMIDSLISFYTTVTVDDRVKAIVVTGSGKAFSAGIDLTMDTSRAKDTPVAETRDPGGSLALAMFRCTKPIIVAYNGLAVGIAMTSTLAAAVR